MRMLVTGHTGFVGQQMLAHVDSRAESDLVCVTPPDTFSLDSIAAIEVSLAELTFDTVVHLAAQSHVPTSFADPESTFETNVLGTVRLLRVLQSKRFMGRFLYVSSGDVYGNVAAEFLPVRESVAPSPSNPYAASKLAAENVCLSWARFAGFEIVVARPFNHLGRGQRTDFSVARFADSIARVVTGKLPPHVMTGRLDVTRDFMDVRDVVEAYIALLRQGQAGEIYNVCSGIESRLEDLLHILIRLSGTSIEYSLDPSLLRPVENLRIVGDASKLCAHTGWRPTHSLEETLLDMLANKIRIHMK
jgi:GDP-4-dehydro-6-deoxy-D-mannose reductase